MHLYKTSNGNILQRERKYYLTSEDWDQLINRQELYHHLLQLCETAEQISEQDASHLKSNYLLAPLGTQEIWAAGVTYLRSRDARMEESEDTGAADCYQRVYEAERPELFFKSLPHRVA